MAIFILSFALIFFTMLAMAISVLFGKAGIKTGCSGSGLSTGESGQCQQCSCPQSSASEAE